MSSHFRTSFYPGRTSINQALNRTEQPCMSEPRSSLVLQQDNSVALTVFLRALANLQNILTPIVPAEYMYSFVGKKITLPTPQNGYPSADAIRNNIYSGNR